MANTYTLLETISVGAAGASSVTFNSIPQTGYTDLVIKVSARTAYTAGSYGDGLNISFNSNTTGYTYRQLQGYDSTAASASGSTQLTGLIPDDAAAQTANVFSNNEIYIPNYTSANNKSYSVDNVVEKNGTTNWVLSMFAGLWSNTAAITSIGLTSSNASTFKQYSTFSLYGVSALGVTPTKAPKATGGSIIMTDGTYWYHTFISSGTFTPATGLSCDYLVVAGGGGGGYGAGGGRPGGGGGAGGYRNLTSQSLTSGTGYTVTVGAGGAGGTSGSGSKGSDSVFGSTTSTGGGFGAAGTPGTNVVGGAGGSGGGGQNDTGGSGNQGGYSPVEGFAGGSNGNSSGGGGSSAAGVSGGATAGAGGAGTSNSINGTATDYAGGGGGGFAFNLTGSSNGGVGGGGSGGRRNPSVVQAVAGTANLGGGGGGGGSDSGGGSNMNGAAGGSGVVIVRYLA